jgi:hypothetical protein
LPLDLTRRDKGRIILSYLFIPVRLSRTDETGPTIPLWGAVLALGLPIVAITVLAGELFHAAFAGWSPLLLIGIAGIFATFLLAMRKESLKQIKALLDMSWNVWSFVGVSFLFYVAVDDSRQRLDAALIGTGPWLKAGLFLVV